VQSARRKKGRREEGKKGEEGRGNDTVFIGLEIMKISVWINGFLLFIFFLFL
jgi:hypothetical protein